MKISREFTDQFIEVRIEPWAAIYSILDALEFYVFRGQSNSEWPLLTSLERCLEQFDVPVALPQNREYWMLHEFKRKFHLYSSNSPDYADSFEWLAIMQHHGCPTRLLDFTYSVFIAAYFAIVESETDAAIWAINRLVLRQRLKERFKLPYKSGEALRDEVNLHHLRLANEFVGHSSLHGSPNFVIPLEPKKCTERMSRQQGLFVMPTNPENTFMHNLYAAFDTVEKVGGLPLVEIKDIEPGLLECYDYPVMKLLIPRSEHDRAIKDLMQMNITSEALFPGLDGLARSLIQTQLRT